MSRGLLHCLFNAENSKGSAFGLIELWESASSDSNKYHLDLFGIKLYITATSHDPLSGARSPITIISNILHCIFIPTYAAELGVDSQADFANQPESQGLLG